MGGPVTGPCSCCRHLPPKNVSFNIPYIFFGNMRSLRESLATAKLEVFMAYFMEPEDYLGVASNPSITFDDIIRFMCALHTVRQEGL